MVIVMLWAEKVNKLLYDICRDAIEKLQLLTEGKQSLLIQVAVNVMTLSRTVRHDDLLAMGELAYGILSSVNGQ